MRTFNYIVVFKTRDHKIIDRTSQFMLLIAVTAFVYSAVQLKYMTWLTSAAITGIIGWMTYCYIGQKRGGTPYYRLALLFAAIAWMKEPGGGWIAIIYFIATLLEKQVKFPAEVGFDTEEIVFNTFPKKHYFWKDLHNVILKDGVLTIDFKNNKLIQREINETASYRDEQDFNEFCKQRLEQ